MDKKRIIFAAVFVVISILLGYAIYAVFFAKKEPVIEPAPGGEITNGEFPDIGDGLPDERPVERPDSVLPDVGDTVDTTETSSATLATEKKLVTKQIDNVPLSSPSASSNGVNFYNQQDGKFYRLLENGKTETLNDQVFYNVSEVTWSPTKDESIIEYPDGANIYYNFDTKKQVTLPKHWKEFSFSPTGDKVAAKSIGSSPDTNWLISSDPDGKNIKLIEPMGLNSDKVTVDWSPNKKIVALSRTGAASGFSRQEVLLVGLNKENFRSIEVEGRGLETQWSPDGNKLLHSVYNPRNEYKPELWVVDATGSTAGGNRRLLNVDTWAHKCTMADERYAYCGVPSEMETGAGFAPQMYNYTPDRLYKIDTINGSKTEIPLEESITINKIFTNKDGSKLFFTDQTGAGIFELPIK